jgi:ComF family protein
MDLTVNVKLLCDAFLTLLYPQACVICQQSVERRAFGVACEECWQSTLLFTGNETICWKCGAPLAGSVDKSRREEVRCHRCDDHAFTAARACGLYEKALRETVLNLKRQPYLPEMISRLILNTVSREPLNESTLIMPVPLHPRRLQMRGFNQASVIARAVSTLLRLPINEVSLIRTSHTEKYRAGLDAKGRTDTVAHAFAVVHPRLIAGEKILLVDDVFTTGATSSECSNALLTSGAETASVLTIARTMR